MTIIIPPHELEEEYQDIWKLDYIKSLSIDFATNSINGFFEDKEVVLFKFKDYGFLTDNRYCTYKLTSGSVGLFIQIVKL